MSILPFPLIQVVLFTTTELILNGGLKFGTSTVVTVVQPLDPVTVTVYEPAIIPVRFCVVALLDQLKVYGGTLPLTLMEMLPLGKSQVVWTKFDATSGTFAFSATVNSAVWEQLPWPVTVMVYVPAAKFVRLNVVAPVDHKYV